MDECCALLFESVFDVAEAEPEWAAQIFAETEQSNHKFTALKQLTGLQDDYTTEGRVLLEDVLPGALPQSLRAHHETLIRLGQVYSQVNAPVGQLGLDTLKVSTKALASTSPGDSTYTTLENKLMSFGQQRDDLALKINALLVGAEVKGQAINEQQAKDLIAQGQSLLAQVHAAAL